MDNATHTFFGLCLARLGFDRQGPWATGTCVAAANLPDLDVIGQAWGGSTFYLCHHRGITHALPGLAVESLVLATGVWLAARRWARVAPAWWVLWLAAALGLLSHLGLDGLNTYGIRPWLPFDDTRYYGDTLFIMDPWLWLLWGGGACLAAPARTRRGNAGWFGFFGVASALVVANAARLPLGAPVLWALVVWGILWARLKGVTEGRRLPAWGGLLVGVAYIGALNGLSREARAVGLEEYEAQHLTVEHASTHPHPGTPWRFRVLAHDDHAVHALSVDLGSGAVASEWVLPRNLDDPWLGQVRATPEYAAWRCFARHPFVGWTPRRTLILGDARYAPEAKPAWCNLELAPLTEQRQE